MPYGQFRFFNIGQGMFYVGKIIPTRVNKTSFSFVYDCGVTGASVFLNEAIYRSKQLIGRQSLDALFISHFDIDHVSGIPKLLKNLDMNKDGHRIKTVVLPYFPLEVLKLVRLQFLHEITFIDKKEDKDELHRLVFNPYAYFLSRTDIGQLVVVSPLDTESNDVKVVPRTWDNDDGLKFDENHFRGDMKAERELIATAQHDIVLWNNGQDKRTEFNSSIRRLVLNGSAAGFFSDMWRWKVLVPPIPTEILKVFQNNMHSDEILNDDGILEWEMFQACCKSNNRKTNQVRKQLLDAYENIVIVIRKSSSAEGDKTINLTSLVMGHEPVCNCAFNKSPKHWICSGVPSTILFGDTDLGNPAIYENIIKGMCRELQRAVILTIPHHGSRRNWNKDILSVLRCNSLWVATSGSDEQQSRLHHPDGSVVCDIWEAAKNESCTYCTDFEWNNEKQQVDVFIFRECAEGRHHWVCNVKVGQRERSLSSHCQCWRCCAVTAEKSFGT